MFYLSKGIQSKAPGVIDGRFYFHLGDALARLGYNDNATKVSLSILPAYYFPTPNMFYRFMKKASQITYFYQNTKDRFII